MAAVTAPAHISVQHQKLLHFVGEGKWSDERVLAKVRELVMPAIERHGSIKACYLSNVWHMTGPLSTRPKNFAVASRSRRAKDRAHHSIGSILPGPVQPDHRIDVVDGDALGLGALDQRLPGRHYDQISLRFRTAWARS